MARRSRKARDPQPRLRGEARDEQIRQDIQPLAEGERPGAVTVAAIVAIVMAAGNLIATALADDVKDSEWTFAILQASILLIAAAGMWLSKYWAVLGFQALLAIQILSLSTGVLLGDNLLGQAVFAVVVVLLGVLFWTLIRAMARLQMPRRPETRPRG
jgi:hypothetical protein